MALAGIDESIERKFLAAVTIQFVAALSLVLLPIVFLGPRQVLELFPTVQIIASAVIVGLAVLAYLNTIWVVRRDILDPVLELREVARELAAGDLERRPSEPFQRDETGELKRAIVELQTQLKDRIDQLRIFRAAVEHAGHAVVITDRDGKIEYLNHATTELTGYSQSEAIGSTPRIWQSGVHSERFYEQMWETLLSGNVFRGEIINERKDGTEIVIHATIAPIENQGEIEQFVAVYDDITEKKRRRRQLRAERERANELQQRVSVLNRVLRHDIRTAVTVIQGQVALLRDRDVMPEQIDAIERRAGELHRLSEQARDIEQTISGEFVRTELDITTVVRDIADELRREFPAAEIETALPETGVATASERFDEAVRQLTRNAIVHNDTDTPTVRLTVELTDELHLEITDNGPGIPDSELTPIEQGEETQLEHTSGLGLWQSYWIVADSDGEMEIDRNEPRGTTVSIRLPQN